MIKPWKEICDSKDMWVGEPPGQQPSSQGESPMGAGASFLYVGSMGSAISKYLSQSKPEPPEAKGPDDL